jgi:hypothetical protein
VSIYATVVILEPYDVFKLRGGYFE